MRFLILSLLILRFSSSTMAQVKKYDLSALAIDKKLTIINRSLQNFPDTKSIKLDEKDGEGLAVISGAAFKTGTIEIDLKGKDLLQKSFIGIAFHIQNDSTYEGIYFRPFNFHATDSVRKIHAVQYICHPQFTWHKLRDERNGEFEKAIANAPDPNGWFHAKVVVTEKQVIVYVNKSQSPSLTVSRLSMENAGGIGLWTGDGSGGEFSALTISPK
jgi:hypothetical protein